MRPVPDIGDHLDRQRNSKVGARPRSRNVIREQSKRHSGNPCPDEAPQMAICAVAKDVQHVSQSPCASMVIRMRARGDKLVLRAGSTRSPGRTKLGQCTLDHTQRGAKEENCDRAADQQVRPGRASDCHSGGRDQHTDVGNDIIA